MKGIETFASMIISALSLERDMCLSITGEPEHRRFIEQFTIAAYKAGARYVYVETPPSEIYRARLDYSEESYLEYNPPWVKNRFDSLVKDKWTTLSLTGNERPDIFESADSRKIGIAQGAFSRLREDFLAAISSNRISWCVTGIPTDGWAQKVLKNKSAKAEDLWNILMPVYRLNTPDPFDALQEHASTLSSRTGYLNTQQLDSLHFSSEGTDLTVGLLKKSVWLGGTSTCVDGRVFFPNIPTEEVFTTPDYRRTCGKVRLTRPVLVMGKTVEDGWFEFKDGKVTDYGAGKNREILDEYFRIDPQACYLGEIALVEEGNPIGASGLVFHNILFDENAACHIALGNGYTDAVKDAESMDSKALLAAGVNVCRLHTDLMFGSPKLTVTGKCSNGRVVSLMENGKFIY